MRTRVWLVAIGVSVLIIGAALTLVSFPGPPAEQRMARLGDCRAGGVELKEQQCTAPETCTTRSVRLTWTRAGGALLENDGSGERQAAQLTAFQVHQAHAALAPLDRRESDVGDRVCSVDGFSPPWTCPPGTRLIVSGNCDDERWSRELMRASLAERIDGARLFCSGTLDALPRAECNLRLVAGGLFKTRLSDRFKKAFTRLQELGHSQP